jgi:hypothetical protein
MNGKTVSALSRLLNSDTFVPFDSAFHWCFKNYLFNNTSNTKLYLCDNEHGLNGYRPAY